VIPAAVSPGKDAATKVTQAAVSPGKDAATKVIPAAAPPGDGWVLIVPGSFTMGSPTSEVGRYSRETQHEVRITQGFYLQKTEVTQAQYQALMGNNPSGFSSCGASCPVEQVNWLDALKYANALSRKDGLAECYVVEKRIGRSAVLHYQIKGIDIYDVGGESAIVKAQSGNPLNCRGYRLPTESEWEYAARAGSQASAYGPLDEVAWYDRNSNNTIHPVAEKRPNVFGLYDMLGNVWEWTWDWYGSYPGGSVTNPIGPKSGTERVFRGGSWGNEFGRLDYPDLPDVRAAFATARRPSFRNSDVGIRLARSAGPVPARPPAKVKEAPL
jgi:formylglycine-generating enzyme required for sulfatase activity